jgi:hypothetical protein
VSATLRQLQLGNFHLYLANHAQQVKDLVLSCRVHLRELPRTLQLDSLTLNGVSVQLNQYSSDSHTGDCLVLQTGVTGLNAQLQLE